MKEKKDVTRNWATIIYPESVENNWKQRLGDLHVMAFISPLHNADINDEGEAIKEHHHIVLMFDGVKTRKQVKEICDSIGGVGVERINSIRAYARYLCHLDEPNKTKYSIEDVESLAGANYLSQISQTTDKYTAIGEMMDYCVERNEGSFARLLLYARDNREDWFQTLCEGSSHIIINFLKSRTWEEKMKYYSTIEKEESE